MRFQDRLVVALALTTGAADATAFERLGHAFASVITGNLVLLGVGAAHGDGRLALLSGIALLGYALGVFAAAPRRASEPDDDAWPRATSVALLVDLALLMVLSVGWELCDGRPGEVAQALLLAVVATAMGVQSSAIRRLGAISTTYLTSTYIGVIEALAARRWSAAQSRSILILGVALSGAAAATAVVAHAERLLPILLLVPLAVVIGAAERRR